MSYEHKPSPGGGYPGRHFFYGPDLNYHVSDDQPFYIAGPMTGIPEYNAPMFRRVAKRLREQGFQIVSPVEMDEADGMDLEAESAHNGQWDWALALARDIRTIINEIGGVIVLPGWTKSRGAFLETETAYAKGIPVLRYPDLSLVDYRVHPHRRSGRIIAYKHLIPANQEVA